MLLRVSLLALALASVAGAVPAQTMAFGCPDPGTTFTFDSGTSVVARGRDGMDCSMEIVGGKPFKVRALLFDNPAPDGTDTSAFIAALRPERLWPLEVGKKIEASYAVGGRTWNYILSVARTEKRLGPGDALFDAFVVEMLEQGAADQRSVSRWWISPVERYSLRYDWSNSTGAANRAIVTNIQR